MSSYLFTFDRFEFIFQLRRRPTFRPSLHVTSDLLLAFISNTDLHVLIFFTPNNDFVKCSVSLIKLYCPRWESTCVRRLNWNVLHVVIWMTFRCASSRQINVFSVHCKCEKKPNQIRTHSASWQLSYFIFFEFSSFVHQFDINDVK